MEDNENYFVTQDGILVHNGYKPEAGLPEHKQQRGGEYQQRGGDLDYDAWSRKYDVAIQNANKGNAAADAYMDEVGWGKENKLYKLTLMVRQLIDD